MSERTLTDLKQKQALPLEAKILLTKARVREWVNYYGEDGVYISFSGGKDSTVLLDLVRNECSYKNIPAVFVDVPTQYPELRDFAKTFDNVTILKPKISFMKACEKYGFPLISKEVAKSVDGAKTYLTRLVADGKILTDRQTRPCYGYEYERLTGTGRYAKRGLEKPQKNGSESRGCENVRVDNEKQEQSGTEEYP